MPSPHGLTDNAAQDRKTEITHSHSNCYCHYPFEYPSMPLSTRKRTFSPKKRKKKKKEKRKKKRKKQKENPEKDIPICGGSLTQVLSHFIIYGRFGLHVHVQIICVFSFFFFFFKLSTIVLFIMNSIIMHMKSTFKHQQ